MNYLSFYFVYFIFFSADTTTNRLSHLYLVEETVIKVL